MCCVRVRACVCVCNKNNNKKNSFNYTCVGELLDSTNKNTCVCGYDFIVYCVVCVFCVCVRSCVCVQ